MKGQFCFVDGAAVHIGAQGADVFKNIDIGQGLAGVEKNGIAVAEGAGELSVLLLYFFSMVDIERRAKFIG